MKSNASRSPSEPVAGETPKVTAGDVVRTGANAHPVFHVIAVNDNRVWIRDLQHGADHVVPIDQCRKIEPSADGASGLR